MERMIQKKNRQLSHEETMKLLERGHDGVMCVNGDDGYPYGVPINYVYMNGYIYVHSAKYGYKVEMLEKDNRVCFSAVLDNEIIESQFTTKYESFIAFGRAEFVEDENEKRQILEELIYRMAPNNIENGMKLVKASFEKTLIIRIKVEEIKGKAYRGISWNENNN